MATLETHPVLAGFSRVELRNPEVDDLMGQSPTWIVRWGTLLLFAVLGVVFAIGWWVRYPDVVPARLVLLAASPPRPVIARTEGRVVRLLAREPRSGPVSRWRTWKVPPTTPTCWP